MLTSAWNIASVLDEFWQQLSFWEPVAMTRNQVFLQLVGAFPNTIPAPHIDTDLPSNQTSNLGK